MLQKRTTLPTILNWYNLWLMGVAVTVESEALYHNQAILLYGLIIDKKNLRTVIIQHYY